MAQYRVERDFQAGLDRLINETNQSVVTIKRHGAEVIGYDIYDPKTKAIKALMWNNNDPAPARDDIWKGHAPILFPICGSLFEGKSTYQGKTIQLGGHGFARKSDFSVQATSTQKQASITYRLVSNESTRKMYPFDFIFDVTYCLQGNQLSTTFTVQNTSNETMSFQCGWHPGFNTTLDQSGREDWSLLFRKGEYIKLHAIESDTSHLTGKRTPLRFEGALNWSHHELYYTMFFEVPKAQHRVYKLENLKTGFGLEFDYRDFPHLAIWGDKKQEFFCVEPCQGLDDHENPEPFDKKVGMTFLPVGQTWQKTATIKPYF